MFLFFLLFVFFIHGVCFLFFMRQWIDGPVTVADAVVAATVVFDHKTKLWRNDHKYTEKPSQPHFESYHHYRCTGLHTILLLLHMHMHIERLVSPVLVLESIDTSIAGGADGDAITAAATAAAAAFPFGIFFMS